MEKFGKMVPDPLQSRQILAILRAIYANDFLHTFQDELWQRKK
ncbi:hypothetical protein ACLHZY_11550 [Aeromonas media]